MKLFDVPRRWKSLAAAFIVESAAGSTYAVGVYANQLKSDLNLSQTGIEIFGGLCFDRFGPRATARTGMLLITLGYLFMWLFARYWLPSDGGWGSVAALAACVVVWASGSVWCDVSVICTSVHNFAPDRGRIVGVLKSFFGLCASIVTQYYSGFFRGDVDGFLLFLTIYLPIVIISGSFFLELVPQSQVVALKRAGRRRVSFTIAWVVVYAAVLTTLSLLENYWSNHGSLAQHHTFSYLAVAVTVGCLLVFTHSAFNVGDGPELHAEAGSVDPSADPQHAPLLSEIGAVDAADEAGPGDHGSGLEEVEEEVPLGMSLVQACKSLEFMLMYFSVLVGAGGGIMLINNIGQVNQSYGGLKGTQSVFVSLISVFNCLGRLGAGYMTDRFQHTVSRPQFLMAFLAMMAAGHGILAIPALWVLYPGCIICGFAYGAYWSLIPTLTADFFGFKEYGAIYSILSTAPSIGGVALSVGLAGTLYQQHIPAGGGTVCDGFGCFQPSFITIAVLCAVAVIGGFWLHRRGGGDYRAGMIAQGGEKHDVVIPAIQVLPAFEPQPLTNSVVHGTVQR